MLTKRAVEKHINSIFLKLGLAGAEDVSKRVKAALLFLSEAELPAPDGRGSNRLDLGSAGTSGGASTPAEETGAPHCRHAACMPGSGRTMSTTPRRPVRVLTVDDQAVFRAAAREVIEATPGFEPLGEATSGTEALATESLTPT